MAKGSIKNIQGEVYVSLEYNDIITYIINIALIIWIKFKITKKIKC